MSNNIKLNDSASVIAFHGIDCSVEAVRIFYMQGIDIFETLGYPVEKMAIEGPGFSGNYTTFKRTHPKLQKVGFNSITAFELAALLPNTVDPMFDFLIYINCEDTVLNVKLSYPYDRGQTMNLISKHHRQDAATFASRLQSPVF